MQALPASDSDKGFVKPLRRTYLHVKCFRFTHIPLDVAEALARNPQSLAHTYCCSCATYAPMAEFSWKDGEPLGGERDESGEIL